MTAVPKYTAMIADCAKWGVADPIIAARLSDKAGLERADIEALITPLHDVEQAYSLSKSTDAPQVQATRTVVADIDALCTEALDLRQMIKNSVPGGDLILIGLALDAKPPEAQDELLGYLVTAYSSAHKLTETQQAALAKRKWDLPRFDAALVRARAAQANNDTQEKAKADARSATDDLYNKIDVLDALYRPIAKEARRVLADLPEILALLQLADGVPAKPARPVPNRDRKPKAAAAS